MAKEIILILLCRLVVVPLVERFRKFMDTTKAKRTDSHDGWLHYSGLLTSQR